METGGAEEESSMTVKEGRMVDMEEGLDKRVSTVKLGTGGVEKGGRMKRKAAVSVGKRGDGAVPFGFSLVCNFMNE